MLVLTRRSGETIVIGNDVTVVVTRISASRVSLAIEADQHVPIRRGELPVEAISRDAKHGRTHPSRR